MLLIIEHHDIEQVDTEGPEHPPKANEGCRTALVNNRLSPQPTWSGVDDQPTICATALASTFDSGPLKRRRVIGPPIDRVQARTLQVAAEAAVVIEVPNLGPGLPSDATIHLRERGDVRCAPEAERLGLEQRCS